MPRFRLGGRPVLDLYLLIQPPTVSHRSLADLQAERFDICIRESWTSSTCPGSLYTFRQLALPWGHLPRWISRISPSTNRTDLSLRVFASITWRGTFDEPCPVRLCRSAVSWRVNKQTSNDTNGTVFRLLVRGQVVTPSYLIFLTITGNVQVSLVKLMLTFIEFTW